MMAAATNIARQRAKEAAELLKAHGLFELSVMDTDSIYINSFDVSKDVERQLRALGFLVMKIQFTAERVE